jgi:hypothetical protein
MKKMKINVLEKRPGKELQLVSITHDIEHIVKGALEVRHLAHKIDIWYVCEPFNEGLEPNILVHDDVIYGMVFFTSHDEARNSISLNEFQIEYVRKQIQSLNMMPIPIYLDLEDDELNLIKNKMNEIILGGFKC